MEFQRFSASDTDALEARIQEFRAKLSDAVQGDDHVAIIDQAADLGGLLITARKEAEALEVLQSQAALTEPPSDQEPTVWFWNAYATALQYLDRREEANAIFSKALALCEHGGWPRVEAMVLQHWGRSLVELGRWDEAEMRLSAALQIRQRLNDPLVPSTKRALEGLAQLRQSAHTPAGPKAA